MLKVSEDLKGLDMGFQLTDREIAVVAGSIKQEWFDIIQKLMENEVKLLNVKLINTEGSNPQEILANHATAKGAAQFYVGFIQRLSNILQMESYNTQAIGTAENPEQPPYPAEFVGQASGEVS